MFFKLIWRNIWRSKRRSIIMISSIAFAAFFTTFNQSNKLGMYNNMIDCSVKYFTGYIQVHKEKFWNERSINSAFQIEDSTVFTKIAEKYPMNLAHRIESSALAFGTNKTKGVMVIGTEPESENQLTNLKKRVIKGDYLEVGDDKVLVGQGLAEYFKVGLGDTIILVGQGYHGSNAVDRFIIKGIVKYPSAEINNSVVFLTLNSSQNFFKAYGLVTSYCINTKTKFVNPITSELGEKLSGLGYEVMDWKTMLPELLQSISLFKLMNSFIDVILYLIVGFSLFSIYFMMVNERTYEFSVLIASGLDRLKLQLSTYSEAVVISITGLIIGLGIAFVMVYYYSLNPIPLTGEIAKPFEKMGIDPVIKFELALKPFLKQTVAILGIALLVGMYSIRKIKRLDISTEIHNQ